MRPIDADALIAIYGDWYTEEGTEEGFIGEVKQIVNTIPTIEPTVRSGKWMDCEEDWRHQVSWLECSECRQAVSKKYNFCPNCGAKMGEQENDN